MKKQKILSAGFTLVEVAAVVLIGGLLLEAGVTALNVYLQSSRVSLTQTRIKDIDAAIIQYMNTNGVLPCPAVLNDAQDSATFGRSITDGLATDCATTSGAGTFKTLAATTPPVIIPANPDRNIVIGAVPVRSLNLPDQEIADAWGSRFVYAVTNYLTVYGSNPNPTQGVIDIRDSNNNPLVGSTFNPPLYAQYVVVSYGSDRAGGYTIAGVNGVACPPVGNHESLNCTLPTATFTNTMQISSQTGVNYFDDYLVYHTNITSATSSLIPSGMVSLFTVPASGPPCPNGWQTLNPTWSITPTLGPQLAQPSAGCPAAYIKSIAVAPGALTATPTFSPLPAAYICCVKQ